MQFTFGSPGWIRKEKLVFGHDNPDGVELNHAHMAKMAVVMGPANDIIFSLSAGVGKVYPHFLDITGGLV